MQYVQMYYHCTRMYGTRTPYPYEYVQMPILVLQVQNTVHTDTVRKSMGTKEKWKNKYENKKVVFELMHATKVSFTEVLLEIPIC